jgi:hypothetical protein
VRRVLEIGSALVAVVALLLVLYNATLVDRRPPTLDRVALSLPAGDAHTGQTLTAIDLEFSEPVQPGSVESRFRVDVSDATGAAAGYVTGTFSWNGPKTSAIFTPSTRLPGSTQFKVSVQAGFQDVSGNAASAAPEFVFRTVGPPIVAAIDPPDAALSVPVDRKLKITFDRLMDTGAVEAALKVSPTVGYQTNWTGAILTLTFVPNLQFGTQYTVTVGEAAVDTGGTHLGAAFSSSFTTLAAGLTAVATIPAPNVAGASLRSPIAIIFDSPVDPASVADSLRITPSVPGSTSVVSLGDDSTARPASQESPSPSPGQVLLFTPSAQLATHTTYTVSLSATVRRLGDPGQVAAPRTWTFTTGQAIASAQNQIAFLSERAGVRNLWLMNPDGSNPRQVTSELVPVTGYDISSDGASIAYAAAGVVHEMRADGTDARTIGGSAHWDYSPTFSPDGRSLIVARRAVDGTDQGFWYVPLPGAADDRERQILPAGAPPIGSVKSEGDGLTKSADLLPWFSRAAFAGDSGTLMVIAGDGQAWLVDLQTPAASPVQVDLRADSVPVWVPAEAGFLVGGTQVSGSNPATAIFRVRVTGELARLVDGIGPAAPDGKGAVAILRGGGSGAPASEPLHVNYVPLGTSAPVPLTTDTDLADRSPTFSPNGDMVLFLRVSTGALDRSEGIWIVQPNGRGLRQLSIDGSYPRWLP